MKQINDCYNGRDEFDPVTLLYQKMEENGIEQARTHRQPVHRYRASEAGACARQIWYRLKGFRPAPKTPSSQMYGICGDVDHDLTRQLMEGHGIKITDVAFNADGTVDELKLVVRDFTVDTVDGPVTITVSSRADGGIFIAPNEEALLEIKGKGYHAFDWLQNRFTAGYTNLKGTNIGPGREAVLAYVKDKYTGDYKQTQVTMKLTKHSQCYLLYKDRDNGQLGFYNEFTGERSGVYVPFNEDAFQEVLQHFAYVEQHCIKDEPPTAEFTPKSRPCTWCPFKYLCHDADQRQVKDQKPYIVYPGPQMEVHLSDKMTPEEQAAEDSQADAEQ